MSSSNAPLVVFVVESGSPRDLIHWARAGHLPTIASLMEQGCWGTLAGPEHVAEPGTGLSLFSGVSRNEHGIYAFRQLRPGTYDLHNVAAADTGIQPFWAHLRGTGATVAVIDAPDVNPVVGLAGAQLAHWNVNQAPHAPLTPCSEPPEVLTEIRRRFSTPRRPREFKRRYKIADDVRDYFITLEEIEKKGEAISYLFRQRRFDLGVVGFFDSHAVGHRMWKHRRDEAAEDSVAEDTELRHAFRDIHAAIDRQMGLLLEDVSAAANVFIVTLLGIVGQYPTQGLTESFCRELGYRATAKAFAERPTPLTMFRRLTPESARRSLSQLLPRSIQERMLASDFRTGTDWDRTTAFSVPHNYSGYVYVNLHGRQPRGIVEAGAEYTELLDRIEEDLRLLIDPRTGECPVMQMTRTADAFGGNPPPVLPDLCIEWKRGRHFMDRIVHPRAELTQVRPHYYRDSYHSFEGFLAAAEPAIRARGDVGRLELLDLAPTFRSLMNAPTASELIGRPIASIVGA